MRSLSEVFPLKFCGIVVMLIFNNGRKHIAVNLYSSYKPACQSVSLGLLVASVTLGIPGVYGS